MESIQKLIYVALSIVFLILALVLLTTLLRSLNPQEQVALANTERLRAAIDEACFRGDSTVKVNLDLPQSMPWFGSVFTILPRWIIKTTGDPNFVVYYETFPVGEAVGWETYHNFENRLIITLDSSFQDKTVEDVKAHILDVKKTYEAENPDKKIEEIFVSNVIINGTFDTDTRFVTDGSRLATRGGQIISGTSDDPNLETVAKKIFNLGDWESSTPVYSKDVFKFVNFMSLPLADKTALKYYACGENALCLKTRDGIYRFPLEHCDGIDYVQLVYDPPKTKEAAKGFFKGAAGVGAGLFLIANVEGVATTLLGIPVAGFGVAELGKTVFFLATSWKVSDFYIASPCSGQTFDVTIEDCSAVGSGQTSCARAVKYPIYKFDDGKLTAKYMKNNEELTASHTACIDNIIGEEENKPPVSDFENAGRCVRIKSTSRVDSSTLKGIGDFCWTFNPYVERDKDSFFESLFNEVFRSLDIPVLGAQVSFSLLQDLTGQIGGLPVTYSTGYDVTTKYFVLEASNSSTSLYDKFFTVHGTSDIQRFLHWGWP